MVRILASVAREQPQGRIQTSVCWEAQGEGSRGPPRPLVGSGQSPGRGFRGQSPDRKRFSVFKNGLEGSPLHRIIGFNRFSIVRNIKRYTIACFI